MPVYACRVMAYSSEHFLAVCTKQMLRVPSEGANKIATVCSRKVDGSQYFQLATHHTAKLTAKGCAAREAILSQERLSTPRCTAI